MLSINQISTILPKAKIIGFCDSNAMGITGDSREVKDGYLYAAIKGTVNDGHQYIGNAIESGAIMILCSTVPSELKNGVVYIVVENVSEAVAYCASAFYDYPSRKLKIVGVTGTNGKTTVCTLCYQLFMSLGIKCGLISTIVYRIGNETLESTHTTPDAMHLNKLLALMVENGCQIVFMEVSSHGVVQNRITGIDFAGGVFTNITHDHLDYHITFDNYIEAKKTFFDRLPPTAFALANKDDRRGNVMLQNTSAKRFTYAVHTIADFKGRVLENSFDGLYLELDDTQVHTFLIGEFNASNLLAIYSIATLLGYDKDTILPALSNLKAAEGRFEVIRNNNINVLGIVDYAHTPDALEKVLVTINDIRTRNEQLITIVGCGGDRDKTKRPKMANVAASLSDKIILTSDNPRSENPDSIIEDMKSGIEPQHIRKTLSITDRKEAIRTACMLANHGDIILLAGKGHEKTQEIAGVKYPFDDRATLRNCLDLITNKN